MGVRRYIGWQPAAEEILFSECPEVDYYMLRMLGNFQTYCTWQNEGWREPEELVIRVQNISLFGHMSSSHYIFKILDEPFMAIYFLPHLPMGTLISCNIYKLIPVAYLPDYCICNISIWNCTSIITSSVAYSCDVKIHNDNFKIFYLNPASIIVSSS